MSSWHTIDMATGQKPRSWKLKLVLSPAILLSLCVWPVFKQLPSVHVCHLVHLCFFTANGFTEALIKSGISRSQWNGYVARRLALGAFLTAGFLIPPNNSCFHCMEIQVWKAMHGRDTVVTCADTSAFVGKHLTGSAKVSWLPEIWTMRCTEDSPLLVVAKPILAD